jgi:TonB-linked SusC/RagA family outer membrane protein
MKKKFFLWIMMIIQLFVFQSISAQKTDIVTGIVNDKSGQPLPGAIVAVKGTKTATNTDFDGKFSIKANENSVLIISFVGFKTQEIPVNNQKSVQIKLADDAANLEEVVVVAYGAQKRVNVTGSVATIKTEQLTVAPVASTTNALAGRLPGLITKQESGLPGADSSNLSIRGFGTPLYIVDGVQSDFNNIDPNEIESISILKDAAAAVYGARAGDGVILVTTKRGTSDKPTITFQSSMTLQSPTNLVKMASSGQMAELWRETQINGGVTQLRFTEQEVQKFYDGTDPDYPNTNWYKLVARDWAPQSQHNLSVRGGSDKIKYYGFIGYLDQESFIKKNGPEYKRYNLRSNIDAKITDNLTMQLDLSSIVENKNYPWRFYNQFDIFGEYWNSEPFWNATLPNSDLIPYAGGGAAIGLAFLSDSKLSGYQDTQSQNLKGTLSLKYDSKAVKGLSAKVFANYNQNYDFTKVFSWLSNSYSYNYSNNTYTQRTTATQPTLTHTDSKSRNITGQFSLNYDRSFGENHQFSALALYEVIDYYSDWISAKRVGYTTTAIDYLFAGSLANQSANGSASEMGRQSLIGRVNYGYKSKYLLEGTLRIDESAKFDSTHRRGYFPSVSAGWRISEENFFKNHVTALDNLKLRLSYSETGKDDVVNFAYLSGYNYGETYLIGANATSGLVATGIANPTLTWENMTLYNAGLEYSLYKRKIYGEFDAFYRDRQGIPAQRIGSLPDTFGATLPIENLNSINTRGFEAIVGTEGKYKDFKWDISANIAWSRSKWGHYDEPEYTDPDQKRLYQKSGQWVDRTFGYKADGVFTSQAEIDALDFVYSSGNGNTSLKPGDIKYVEKVKDGLLDWRDQVEIGKGTTPHWAGGLNMNFKYKNFDMSALFQGAFGFYNQIKLRWGNNFSELMYNERWTSENNKKDVLIERLGGAASNSLYSDFYYKKADYLRLKTLSIGYSLPKSVLEKAKIQSLRIYASAMNIFTWSGLTKYQVDPEAPNGYGGSYYPQMVTISYGLNLTF